MSADLWLKILCSMLVNAVLFGIGTVAVLTVPALADQARLLLPGVVVASFVTAPFIAAWIAPRLRLRNWGRRGWREGDAISG